MYEQTGRWNSEEQRMEYTLARIERETSGNRADLDRSEEAVPVEVDGPSYEWRCIGSVVCDQMLDVHGRECDRVNDEARRDFYEDLVGPEAADVEEVIAWHARRANPAIYAGDLGA